MKNSIAAGLRRRVVRALTACPPGVATRILATVASAPEIFGLKNMLPFGLTTTHMGYLTRQILDVQAAAAGRGTELRILLVNEWEESIEAYHQMALNPAQGRILLCAIGPEAESALQAIAVAEQKWPQAESRFDLDGAPINENDDSKSYAGETAASQGV